MKKIIFFAMFFSTLYAQNININFIKTSDAYYWGEGVSFDEDEARDKALKDLSSRIAVHVSHNFEQKFIEHNLNLEENVKSVRWSPP